MACESELALEIRQLISLLIKQHVRVWYTKLTQDEELFEHFHNLTDHVRTTLSGRAQAVDWQQFFLGRIPGIILRHLEDFNLATDRCRANLPLEGAFLALQSHSGIENQETYLMNVADALVVILLPENDLTSDLVYGFVRELLSDLVLKTVIERLSEAWFWDEVILKMHHNISARCSMEKDRGWRALSRKSFWTSWWSTIRHSWSSRGESFETGDKSRNLFSALSSLFNWDLLVLGPIKRRMAGQSLYDTAFPRIFEELLKPTEWSLLKPTFISFILPLLDLLHGDRILHKAKDALEGKLSDASLTIMVRIARKILFPNDEPSPSRIIPSEVAQEALRRQLSEILPANMNIPFFRSKQINKQLLFNILDALLGTLFPELVRRSPQQLKEKVIRIRQANLEATGSGGISTIRSPKSATGLFPELNGLPETPSMEGPSRSERNLNMFEASQEGLEALQAMRRSFEIKRRQAPGVFMTAL